jgi:hypothetical protein
LTTFPSTTSNTLAGPSSKSENSELDATRGGAGLGAKGAGEAAPSLRVKLII